MILCNAMLCTTTRVAALHSAPLRSTPLQGQNPTSDVGFFCFPPPPNRLRCLPTFVCDRIRLALAVFVGPNPSHHSIHRLLDMRLVLTDGFEFLVNTSFVLFARNFHAEPPPLFTGLR